LVYCTREPSWSLKSALFHAPTTSQKYYIDFFSVQVGTCLQISWSMMSTGRHSLSSPNRYAFFFPAAFAFAALFLLLRIITTLKKEPTTADPKRMRITGIRIAQTRGGKTFCRGWSESTKGYVRIFSSHPDQARRCDGSLTMRRVHMV
jgi:hypothetical protein